MLDDITVSASFPAPARRLFEAWLDSDQHSAFTGGEALIDPGIGGRFTAWDGYIEGQTVELEPFRRIVQSWRTSEFPEGSPDSLIEVLFLEEGPGTKVTLVHTGIPAGQGERYRQGWEDYYFAPMRVWIEEGPRAA